MTAGARIVVLGGGYAGLTAAARLAEGGHAVTLVDAKSDFVERIRLHEAACGTSPRRFPYGEFLAARGAVFCHGQARALDPKRKTVAIETAADGAIELPYDKLVYAMGSFTDRGLVPGAAEHARGLDSVSGARAIFAAAQAIAAKRGRLVVVGGGLTGIEAATELAERIPGLDVALVSGQGLAAGRGPGGLSPGAVAHIRRVMDRLGIAVISGIRVAAVMRDCLNLVDGRGISCDLCLWTAGFAVPDLARRAGIAVDDRGKVLTDPALRSISHSDILAIGDAAAVVTRPGGAARMSCAVGRPMGQAAADAIAALLRNAAPAPFFFGYSFRCVSLGRSDGLIQFVDATDAPLADIWTGARAARWKEYICRRTIAGIGVETNLGPPPDQPPPRPS